MLYKETPLALALGLIGQVKDAGRYGKTDGKDLAWRVSYGALKSFNIISDMSFVSNVSDFLGMVTGRDPEALQRWAGRTGGMVVPNAIKQVDLLFDPRYRKADGFATFYSQIPFVRQELKPELNAFGEPVKWSPNIFWANENPDPAWRFLTEKKIWIGDPGETNKIGNRTITDEELYRLVEISGPEIKAKITEMLPRLQMLNQEHAAKAVQSIVKAYREKGKAQIWKESQVR